MYYKSFQELWTFLHGKYVEIKPKEYKPKKAMKPEEKPEQEPKEESKEEPKAEPKKRSRKKKEE